jgi:hypothetical protein
MRLITGVTKAPVFISNPTPHYDNASSGYLHLSGVASCSDGMPSKTSTYFPPGPNGHVRIGKPLPMPSCTLRVVLLKSVIVAGSYGNKLGM